MRLGLGTAQFGLDYGVSNPTGKVRIQEIRKILELAATSGVSILDTAPAYGASEAAIGSALGGRTDFRIVTKTPVFARNAIDENDVRALAETFRQSREALRRDQLYGLLFHRAADVLKPGGKSLIDAALRLVETGAVEKIGVSVYTGADIERILELFTPDIVQVPVNVFDQRLLVSGHLANLRSLGTEIHIRSVFLQGLLLMNPDRIPPYFEPFKAHIARYFDAVAAAGMSRLEAALAFAMSLDADVALIGVTSVQELQEVLRYSHSQTGNPIDYGQFAQSDPRLVEPSRWQLDT